MIIDNIAKDELQTLIVEDEKNTDGDVEVEEYLRDRSRHWCDVGEKFWQWPCQRSSIQLYQMYHRTSEYSDNFVKIFTSDQEFLDVPGWEEWPFCQETAWWRWRSPCRRWCWRPSCCTPGTHGSCSRGRPRCPHPHLLPRQLCWTLLRACSVFDAIFLDI